MDSVNTTELDRLWATRPVRPAAGRTVAGVCAGIGARYRVDPTLIKIAFVVATVCGGSGMLFYIAAWIVFPNAGQADDELGPDMRRRLRSGRRPRGRHRQFVLVVILAIIVASSLGNRTWQSGGVMGAALMLLGWWLLYHRTPEPLPGTSADNTSADNTGAENVEADDLTSTTASATPTTTPVGTVPPAWDPLGTARFAWDLPDPPPAAPERSSPERRSPLTLVIVGIAVLVLAGGAAARQLGIEWFTPAHLVALALTVVGLGLVYAGLRRRETGRHSSGLVPVALILAVAAVLTSTVGHLDGLPSGGIGDRRWNPPTENDIQRDYRLTAGNLVLDLRQVRLTTDREVDVQVGVGNVRLLLPDGMNVRADCSAEVGNTHCPTGLSGGSDGTAGAVLRIDAHTRAGNVEVTR